MELIFLLSKINILENCAKYYTGLYLLLSFKAMWFQTVEGLLLATTLALLPWKDFQGNRNCFSPNSPMVSMAHDMNSIICCKAIPYKWCLSAYIFNGHLEPPILWGTHFPLPGDLFSSWLNKGTLTSTDEIKGFVGFLSHQVMTDPYLFQEQTLD